MTKREMLRELTYSRKSAAAAAEMIRLPGKLSARSANELAQLSERVNEAIACLAEMGAQLEEMHESAQRAERQRESERHDG